MVRAWYWSVRSTSPRSAWMATAGPCSPRCWPWAPRWLRAAHFCADCVPLHLAWQIQRQYRERDKDRQAEDVGDHERNDTDEDRGEVDVLHHGLDDEHVHPDRRM